MSSLTDFLVSNEYSWGNALSEWGISHIHTGIDNFPKKSLFPDAEIFTSLKFSNNINNYHFFDDNQTMNIQMINNKYSNNFYKIADINVEQISINFESNDNYQIYAILFDGNITNRYSITSNPIKIPITSSSANIFLSIGSQDTVKGNLIVEKSVTEISSIYPNPVSIDDKINFEYSLSKTYDSGKINFYNILGQKTNSIKVKTNNLIEGNHKISISPQNITKSETPSGIYFLQLQLPDKIFIKKFTFIK